MRALLRRARRQIRSAPETLVQGVLEGLQRFGEIDISTLTGVAEDVRFRFPKELSDA